MKFMNTSRIIKFNLNRATLSAQRNTTCCNVLTAAWKLLVTVFGGLFRCRSKGKKNTNRQNETKTYMTTSKKADRENKR